MGEMSQFVDRSEETLPAERHGVEAYISEDYARAERDKLWRKCWLQAGRVEDIPEVGNYINYDILDDSVLIVRTASDRIKAFANVCTHRGRRLVDTPLASAMLVARAPTSFAASTPGLSTSPARTRVCAVISSRKTSGAEL